MGNNGHYGGDGGKVKAGESECVKCMAIMVKFICFLFFFSLRLVISAQEENDALRCQLEASKNEVDLIKADLRTELEMKDQQLRSLQQVRSNSESECLGMFVDTRC